MRVMTLNAVASSGLSARKSVGGSGMAESDWRGLMIAAQSGNGGAYRRLLEEVGAWLRRYYRRRLPPSMIDDAAQDALLAVHQKRHTYDPARPFEPWLAAIARYKWIDRLRALKRAPSEALSLDIEVEDHEMAVVTATVLDALLRGLKPAQSEVIRLVKIRALAASKRPQRTQGSRSRWSRSTFTGGWPAWRRIWRRETTPMDDFLEGLVSDLKPVRPRRPYLEALVLAMLCLAELALWLAFDQARPDLTHAAQTTPAFWWKLTSFFGLLAMMGAATAISSLNPAASPRRGLTWIAVAIGGYFVVGAFMGEHLDQLSLARRLNWREGIYCLTHVIPLSVPVWIGLGLLMRNGAPTQVAGTSLACGVTAAAWAAFVFTFGCTQDDPLYVVVWYSLACALSALLARLRFSLSWPGGEGLRIGRGVTACM